MKGQMPRVVQYLTEDKSVINSAGQFVVAAEKIEKTVMVTKIDYRRKPGFVETREIYWYKFVLCNRVPANSLTDEACPDGGVFAHTRSDVVFDQWNIIHNVEI